MCFIGDMGDGSESQRRVAGALSEENCDRIFVVGDVIYSKGIESADDPLLKERFVSIYEQVTTSGKKPPFSIVLGNHDFAGNEKAWIDVPKIYPWVFYPHYYYLQKINAACFVAMETDFYAGPFRLESLIQKWWLGKIQDEMKDCQLKVLFAHHPYVGKRPATGWLKDIYEELVVGKFDIVVTGHDHILRDMGKKDGTHFFISGAGGQYEDNRPGFLVLELEYRDNSLQSSKTRFHVLR